MPMLSVSDSLNLPNPVVRSCEPHWLFAETIHLAGVTGLLVYRSLAIRDTDPIYEDVADLLFRAASIEIVVQETIEDDQMWLGRAETFFGILYSSDKPTEHTDTGVLALIELMRSFKGGVVHPLEAADQLVQRLDLDRLER